MGKKATLSSTTNEDIKGGKVVTSSYDWLDPEKMETQLANTQNYLKAKSEDFTAFDEKKGNANLAIQARYKAYKNRLDKALQEKDSKKYAQLHDVIGKVSNVLEKNKLAEQYGLDNPDFYVDQKTILGKDFDDYIKVRNYVGEMYGYKNLGIDVEKDKHGSRMSAQDVTPRQTTRASQFVSTGTPSTESNKTREESFDQDITYNLDTKTYGIKFTNPLVQERIETRLRPNPTEQGVGFKGMKAGKGAEFQDAAQAQKEAQAAKEALNTNIVKDLPKKRNGTDNTIPKLYNGTQGLTGDQYAGLAAGTAQIAGGVVEATDTQKNGKKSVGGAALTGAASGAAMGASVGGPWGAAIGGVVGGAAGGISAAIGNKKIDKQMAAQAARDAEAKKLSMFTPMKNTQAPMYKKGTAGAVNNKLVEVEKDEVVLRKGMDGSFTKVADFKGGKSHERGGEDYILKAGDVVFPGHKRDLINSYLSKRDFAAIDRERQKLPKEVPGTKLQDGTDTTPRSIEDLKIDETYSRNRRRHTTGAPKAPYLGVIDGKDQYGKPYTSEERKIIDEYLSKKISHNLNNTVGGKVYKSIDPTGISSWGDVKKAWTDGKLDLADIIEPLGAIPMIGKVPKAISYTLHGISTINEFSSTIKPKLRHGGDFSATPKPGQYGFNTIEEEGLPISTNAKLKLKTDVALPSTTTLATRAPQTTASNTKEPKDNSLAIQKGLAFLDPLYKIVRGSGPIDKVQENYLTAPQIQHKNMSAAELDDIARMRRVNSSTTGTSAKINQAQKNMASVNAFRERQAVLGAESREQLAVANQNAMLLADTARLNSDKKDNYNAINDRTKALAQDEVSSGLRGIGTIASGQMLDARLDKRDYQIASEWLGSDNWAFSKEKGIYFIRNADGTIGTSKTKPTVG